MAKSESGDKRRNIIIKASISRRHLSNAGEISGEIGVS